MRINCLCRKDEAKFIQGWLRDNLKGKCIWGLFRLSPKLPQFGGLERDAESGTEHAQFRNYATAQGRWLSPDPALGSYDVTNPQTFNRYPYALNNPTSFTDKAGREVCQECWGPGGGDDDDDDDDDDGGPGPGPGPNPPPPGIPLPRGNGPARLDPNYDPGSLGESLGIPIGMPRGNWGVLAAIGLPGETECEFGACGDSFVDPVAVGGAAVACIEAEPCGVIGGVILGAGLLYHIYIGAQSQPTIEGSSAQEQRLLDFVAKAFCVNRKALGNAIHQEKIGRQKGKKSDLTLEEIKELARYLPKIPGCTPTAF